MVQFHKPCASTQYVDIVCASARCRKDTKIQDSLVNKFLFNFVRNKKQTNGKQIYSGAFSAPPKCLTLFSRLSRASFRARQSTYSAFEAIGPSGTFVRTYLWTSASSAATDTNCINAIVNQQKMNTTKNISQKCRP